MTEINKKP